MSTPNEVGAALAEIHARTGWSWAEVANQVGTTPTYARKLASGAGKFGHSAAGASLRSNLAGYQATGTAQAPQQRRQAVRAAGGGSRPAEPRMVPPEGAAFKVERSVFRGVDRDGWAVQVTIPNEGHPDEAGDREDARNAITDAVRRAAQGKRRVAFRVTVTDSTEPSGRRTVELGQYGGYYATDALAGINGEGPDPLAWLVTQDLDRYGRRLGDEDLDDEDEAGAGILAVEVIALP